VPPREVRLNHLTHPPKIVSRSVDPPEEGLPIYSRFQAEPLPKSNLVARERHRNSARVRYRLFNCAQRVEERSALLRNLLVCSPEQPPRGRP